jgi:signal transduction histidine kinase
VLTAINANVDLALMDVAGQDPAREALEEIRHAASRAADLTRQLLAFSRQQVLRLQSLDLDAVVADVERMLRRLISEDVELVTSPSRSRRRVRVDRSQIEQVLVNLVVNARDAMPHGGVIVLATHDVDLERGGPAHLTPDLPPGRYVALSVSDTGSGMDDATRARIFEPFFTTKEVGKGTGLGLATVYGIVRQSGGDVLVRSTPGRGTVFTVYLPEDAGD